MSEMAGFVLIEALMHDIIAMVCGIAAPRTGVKRDGAGRGARRQRLARAAVPRRLCQWAMRWPTVFKCHRSSRPERQRELALGGKGRARSLLHSRAANSQSGVL